jgi:hypothetical protein
MLCVLGHYAPDYPCSGHRRCPSLYRHRPEIGDIEGISVRRKSHVEEPARTGAEGFSQRLTAAVIASAALGLLAA